MFEDSLFGGLDVASAADDPFSLPLDTYRCTISGAVVAPTKDESKVGITFKYTVREGHYTGRELQDWKEVPPKLPEGVEPDADYMQKLAFLKQRMLSFGIPESRINQTKPADVIGIDILVTLVKSKKTKKTVFGEIRPDTGDGPSLGLGTNDENPFA